METITKAEAARLLEVSSTWVAKLAKKGELRQNEKGLLFRVDVETLRQNRIAGTIQEQLRNVRNQLETMIEEKKQLQDKNNDLTIAKMLAEKEKELLAIQLESTQVVLESSIREKESIESNLNRLLEAQASQIHSLQEDKRNQAAKIESLEEDKTGLQAEKTALLKQLGFEQSKTFWSHLFGTKKAISD